MSSTTPTKQIQAVHRITPDVPPGGGACWWCSKQLYRRQGVWHFAEIVGDDGHSHAVHLRGCEDGRRDPRQNGEGVQLNFSHATGDTP